MLQHITLFVWRTFCKINLHFVIHTSVEMHNDGDNCSNNVEEKKELSHSIAGKHTTWETARDAYDKWAVTYDKDHTSLDYSGPRIVALTLQRHISDKKARILDVGCGTGFVGEQLGAFGYTNIDGLDGSEEMLKQAGQKNIYQKLILECLTPTPSKYIYENEYDAIVMCGAFGGGHLAANIWVELIRITKPGGYIINAMREKWLELDSYKDTLEEAMDKLVLEGKWEKLSREVLKQYVHTDAGVLHVCKVL